MWGYQRTVADRCLALGMERRKARMLAGCIGSAADSKRVHGLLDIAPDAGAMDLVPLAVRVGLSAGELGSLLRACGAAEGQRPTVDALAAARHALLRRVEPPIRRARPSPYLQRSH
jgi:hypothetical protein